VAFFAPRPFFAGRAALEPVAVDEVLLEVSVRAPAPAEAEFVRKEDDVTVRGAAVAGAEESPPVAGAELGRPIDGGPAGCGEAGALGFEALEVLTPSVDMPPGNLHGCRVGSISGS